jgi:CDP-glycerol glycerophosphotransferase
VYGRDGGKFSDNCKHLLCGRNPLHGIDMVYVARDKTTSNAIRAHGARSIRRGSFAEFRAWLRAGTIFVDSVDWAEGFRYAASHGARIVQMWHGIPLKLVQQARIDARKPRPFPFEQAYRLYLAATGRSRPVDWFLSTSPFVTDHAFRKSFHFDNVSHAGYPRNDALFDPNDPLRLLNVDMRARDLATTHRSGGGKVGVYAPTFRNALNDPFADGTVDLGALSDVCSRLGVLLLVKLHPWMHGRLQSVELPGLVFVAPDSDLYPLLPLTDFLVTDYSSVFFDYLLLDRPVLFFPYDLDTYLAEERPMYFDYDQMTPGPKAFDMQALVSSLSDAVAGKDDWSEPRARIRGLVFEHRDGRAAERLLGELFPAPGP